jgi:3-hydroxybutyryl-CoA dehydrogenase
MTAVPERLGVVGAGTMGAGIAQLGCAAGMETLLQDPVADALAHGAERVREGLAKWLDKGRVGALGRPRSRRPDLLRPAGAGVRSRG